MEGSIDFYMNTVLATYRPLSATQPDSTLTW